METKSNSSFTASVCAVIICSGLFVFIGSVFGFYYDLNDDVLMADILSGAYTGTPDAHNIQMMYPIAWLIKQLYVFYPQFKWMGIVEIGLMWLCAVCIMARTQTLLQNNIENAVKRVLFIGGMYIAYIVFALGICLWELVMVQYTVVSGLLTATAAFLIYTDQENEVGSRLVPIILAIVAFNIRSEMFLLLCPFLATVGFCRWISEGFDKKTNKRYLLSIGLVLAGMALTVGINAYAYRSEEWKEFNRLFDARTEVYDFTGIPDYDENKAFYDSQHTLREDYDRLVDYNYVLSGRVNASLLEKIAEYAGEHSIYKRSIPQAVFENIKYTGNWKLPGGRSRYNDTTVAFYEDNAKQHIPFNMIVVFLYALCVIAAIKAKDIRWAYTLPVLFVMRMVSWVYITYRGRVNARITHPLYITEILILAGILIMAWIETDFTTDRIKKITGWLIIAGFSAAAVIAAIYIPSTIRDDIRYKSELREKNNKVRDAIYEYTGSNPRKYYLLDVYSTVGFTEKITGDHQGSKGNTQLAGGWAALSPLDAYKQSFYANREDWRFISVDDLSDKWDVEEELTAADGSTVYVYVMK